MDDVATFDRFARAYDLFAPRTAAWALRTGLAHAERPVGRVLDLAGGTGRGGRAIEASERVVLDAAPGMVSRARSRGHPGIVGDAARLPLEAASVDAVLIVDALHHLPDREAALAEAARVLRRGGVLVVADFDPRTVRGRALAGAERLVGLKSRFVTPDALAAVLLDVGLEPVVIDRGFGYVLAGVPSGKNQGHPR
jgi:demethylmenaquinone methyltransferase/2-methoxy-6-polyprenyl-1,4-benzoquinol methylase